MKKKCFLIINQTAGSPAHGMVFRNYYIAKEWVRSGHKAIIISGSYFHNFSQLPQTKGLFTKEEIDGIEYWWVKLPRYSQSKSLGRLLTLFLFPLILLLFPFWRLSRPGTIIVSGPPHLTILNAWFWSKIWNSKLIYEVRDIWPLTIVKLGRVNPLNPIILVLSFFERFAYKVSDRVVSVLSLSYRHFESKGMSPDKFVYIPNGVDTSVDQIVESETSQWIKELSKTKKTVIYTGSFGIANNLEQIIEAAELLKEERDLHFVFIGDGPYRDQLIKKSSKMKNVTFLKAVTKKEIPAILAYADICYVGFLKSDLFRFGISPNKLFDYMAARKPIVMAIETDDNIVERANCGILVSSCLPVDIAKAISKLNSCTREELKTLGANGREYLEKHHTYSKLAQRYEEISTSIVEGREKFAISPFLSGFIITLLLGLIAQTLAVLFPSSFSAGLPLYLEDSQYFHMMASKLSDLPWEQFQVRPDGHFPTFFLAVFYKIMHVKAPFIIFPLLCILAGLTVKALSSSLKLLGIRGRWWPILISVFFTITPTSLPWLIYPHKDSFIVPGVMLVAWSFLSAALTQVTVKNYLSYFAGTILIFANKPYLAEILNISILTSVPFLIFLNHPKRNLRTIGFVLTCLIANISVLRMNWSYSNVGDSLPQAPTKTSNVSSVNSNGGLAKTRYDYTLEYWNSIEWLGRPINKVLASLAYTRERFLSERKGSTNFKPDLHLKGAWDTIKYFPSAIQLALLEPLPWRKKVTGSNLSDTIFIILKIEMIIIYIVLLFLIFSGRSTLKKPVIICILLALPFLFALGFAIPNIGSINRYRFPFLILIKIAGLAAIWNSSRFHWPGRFLMWADPPKIPRVKEKVLFLVPDDVTFIIQRLVMAQGAQKAGYDVHVAAEDTGVSNKVRDLGFTFHKLDLNRGGLNPFADFKPFLRLVFFLAKERPDILQCVSIKPVLYGATAGTIVGLKKIVCLVNGMGYAFEGQGFKGKIIKTVAMALYRNALALPGIRVIFQNPDDRSYFIDNKLVDANKTLLIRGSGVNMEKFKPSPQPENPQPVILFVGRLLWNKGIKELVEAARILKNENLKFTLKIVGGPDDRNPEAVPKAFLDQLHSEGIIDWVGRQSDMPKFYRESDVICLPTQYKEGLPLTLLEAASTGRALVATDVPGCREIVRDGINGFLVPSKSVTELADALRKLIQSAELRTRFGENSAQIVRGEFASPIIQSQLVGVYESLLNDSAPSGNNLVHA